MGPAHSQQDTVATETSPINSSILIVDDDLEICDLLQRYFTKHGFDAHIAHDRQGLEKTLVEFAIDIIILDLMLPGDDGFTICKALRTHTDVPIIILTADNDETDRVVGLELGADDYVEKPFNARELLARVRAVLRRHQSRQSPTRERVRYRHFGKWRLDCLKRTLEHGKIATKMGNPEFRLLEILLDRANKIISRDELSLAARGREHIPYDRTIDIQISRLRQMLHDNGATPELVRTIRNEGYILLAEVRDEY
ncbi:MAG: response regulator [Gammaproteobacteria bacterium]|nr:response regulator [Gammaproteobacteria bacterium]